MTRHYPTARDQTLLLLRPVCILAKSNSPCRPYLQMIIARIPPHRYKMPINLRALESSLFPSSLTMLGIQNLNAPPSSFLSGGSRSRPDDIPSTFKYRWLHCRLVPAPTPRTSRRALAVPFFSPFPTLVVSGGARDASSSTSYDS